MAGRLSNESPLWSIVLGALGLAFVALIVALVVVARRGAPLDPASGATAIAESPSAPSADSAAPDDAGADDAAAQATADAAIADEADAGSEPEPDAGRATTASVPVQHKPTKPAPKHTTKHRRKWH